MVAAAIMGIMNKQAELENLTKEYADLVEANWHIIVKLATLSKNIKQLAQETGQNIDCGRVAIEQQPQFMQSTASGQTAAALAWELTRKNKTFAARFAAKFSPKAEPMPNRIVIRHKR